MLRGRAQQGMATGAKLVLIELFQRSDDATHPADGTYSQVPAAAMRGMARGNHLYPHKSLVAKNQTAFAGLGEDAGIGFMPLDEILRTDTGVFFVGHQGHQYLP